MASSFALACITCDVFYELRSKDYIPHHFLTALVSSSLGFFFLARGQWDPLVFRPPPRDTAEH